MRRSFSIASYLTYALRHVGRRTILIDGLGGMFNEQLGMIGEKDAVIAISFTPYANETVEMVEKAVSSGAKLVSITDSQVSPVSSLSDVCFVVKEASVEGFRAQSASLCLAQTLAVSLAGKNE